MRSSQGLPSAAMTALHVSFSLMICFKTILTCPHEISCAACPAEMMHLAQANHKQCDTGLS